MDFWFWGYIGDIRTELQAPVEQAAGDLNILYQSTLKPMKNLRKFLESNYLGFPHVITC